jgi:glycine/D-amino acid oxidase-like deaminating enzyme
MINRRTMLTASAGLAVAACSRSVLAAPAVNIRGGAVDIVVVGAGAFGGWIALVLRERGLKVLCIDQYGPATPRAASAGETRSIRSGYGAAAIYSAWAAKALKLWNARQAEFGRTLLYPNDRVELANTWGNMSRTGSWDGRASIRRPTSCSNWPPMQTSGQLANKLADR